VCHAPAPGHGKRGGRHGHAPAIPGSGRRARTPVAAALCEGLPYRRALQERPARRRGCRLGRRAVQGPEGIPKHQLIPLKHARGPHDAGRLDPVRQPGLDHREDLGLTSAGVVANCAKNRTASAAQP